MYLEFQFVGLMNEALEKENEHIVEFIKVRYFL